MVPVSLTYADLIRLIKCCGYVVLLLSAGIVFVRRADLQAEGLKVIWQGVSTALLVPPLLVLCLAKLEWKYPWLATLLGKRMVHGLWWGELKTEFRPAEDAPPCLPSRSPS